MEQERYSLKRPSIGSRRSHSSDRSLQCLIEDLSGRVPRYNDLVYVMSIESENQKKSRGSDMLEKLGHNNSIRYSNEGRSMEIEHNNLSRGSHGILGKYQPKLLQSYHQQPMRTHQCDCYRDCVGANCGCFMTLLVQPCIEGKCCSGCIELKNKRIQLAAEENNVAKFVARPSAPIIITKLGCSCKKTRCLKLYCECFSKKGFCSENCNCEECLNMEESQARSNAMVENSNVKDEERGCNCKKTKCQKKYCACFGAGMKCTKLCQCQNCGNMNEELKAIRNFCAPCEQPFYPPIIPVAPVDKLPTNIQFTEYQLPNFGNLHIS